MGRCEQRPVEQAGVDLRLVLPDVEHPLQAACREGFAVHDLAARGVDDCGTGFHLPEKGGIGHVAGRGVERRVEGEQVGFAGHLPERQEAAVFALLARRVARQHAEAPRLGILPHERSDMAHAYDAERPVGRLPALRAREMDEHGADPLQHTAGIAAGGCGDVDAAGGAPGEVDMVESDGRRGDEPHAGAFEQRGVASRAGADDQGVGVADVGRRNRLAGEVPYLGIRFQNPFQEGNGAVGDDFHAVFGRFGPGKYSE